MARALPAVDVEGLSGHEGGRFEIEDSVHDVGDLAHSAERVEAAERLMRLDGMHRRFDDAGSDRVRPDAAFRVFDRQRPRGGIETSLCQGCEHGGHVRVRMVYEARRDLDDVAAAPLLHLSDRELRHVEESCQIDAEHHRVIGLAVLREGLRDEDAGVVDERVDTPEPRHAFGDRTLGRPPVSDVARNGQDVRVVGSSDRARNRDDPVAATAIPLDERCADALRCASDDGNFPFTAHDRLLHPSESRNSGIDAHKVGLSGSRT